MARVAQPLQVAWIVGATVLATKDVVAIDLLGVATLRTALPCEGLGGELVGHRDRPARAREGDAQTLVDRGLGIALSTTAVVFGHAE